MAVSCREFFEFAELALGCAEGHRVNGSILATDPQKEIKTIEQQYQRALRQFLVEFWPHVDLEIDSLTSVVLSSDLKEIRPIVFPLQDWRRVYKDKQDYKFEHPLQFVARAYARALSWKVKTALENLGDRAALFSDVQGLLIDRKAITTYPCHTYLDQAIQGGAVHGCDISMQYCALPINTTATCENFDDADFKSYSRLAQSIILRQSLSDIRVDTYVAACMKIDSDKPCIFEAVRDNGAFDLIWNPQHDSYFTHDNTVAFHTFFHDKQRLQKYGISALPKARYGCAAAYVPYGHSTIVKVLVENIFTTMQKWLFEYHGLEECCRYYKDREACKVFY